MISIYTRSAEFIQGPISSITFVIDSIQNCFGERDVAYSPLNSRVAIQREPCSADDSEEVVMPQTLRKSEGIVYDDQFMNRSIRRFGVGEEGSLSEEVDPPLALHYVEKQGGFVRHVLAIPTQNQVTLKCFSRVEGEEKIFFRIVVDKIEINLGPPMELLEEDVQFLSHATEEELSRWAREKGVVVSKVDYEAKTIFRTDSYALFMSDVSESDKARVAREIEGVSSLTQEEITKFTRKGWADEIDRRIGDDIAGYDHLCYRTLRSLKENLISLDDAATILNYCGAKIATIQVPQQDFYPLFMETFTEEERKEIEQNIEEVISGEEPFDPKTIMYIINELNQQIYPRKSDQERVFYCVLYAFKTGHIDIKLVQEFIGLPAFNDLKGSKAHEHLISMKVPSSRVTRGSLEQFRSLVPDANFTLPDSRPDKFRDAVFKWASFMEMIVKQEGFFIKNMEWSATVNVSYVAFARQANALVLEEYGQNGMICRPAGALSHRNRFASGMDRPSYTYIPGIPYPEIIHEYEICSHVVVTQHDLFHQFIESEYPKREELILCAKQRFIETGNESVYEELLDRARAYYGVTEERFMQAMKQWSSRI